MDGLDTGRDAPQRRDGIVYPEDFFNEGEDGAGGTGEGWRDPGFAADAGDPRSVQTARVEKLEDGQVGGQVHGETVVGHSTTDANADGGDLAKVSPYASEAGLDACGHSM